jgi:hypothetical protein
MPLVILHHLLNVFVQLSNKKRGFTKKKIYGSLHYSRAPPPPKGGQAGPHLHNQLAAVVNVSASHAEGVGSNPIELTGYPDGGYSLNLSNHVT